MILRARHVPLWALLFGLFSACKASVNAEASASADGNANARADASASGETEGQGEMTRATAAGASGPGTLPELSSSRVLLGARHDLKLRPGKGTASCACLSVALGDSNSNGMQWSSAPPDIDEATQLTIALSSEGSSCKDEPKGSLGASYWGYRISGNDVVVLVEAARSGRPMTSGAVIPRPVGPGLVYVAPASKKLPYGRALDGTGPCKIGNPGQPRTGAFTELELGSDAPAAGAGRNNGLGNGNQESDTPTTIDMSAN